MVVIPSAPESRSRMQHGQCWIVAAETSPPARELNLPQGKAFITPSEGQWGRDKEETTNCVGASGSRGANDHRGRNIKQGSLALERKVGHERDLQGRFWDRGARTAETSPLVPDAGSELLEERCKTLKAEMETVLAATIQLIVSQVSGLAGRPNSRYPQ